MSDGKLESLKGGSGVHVFLRLWKAANAVQSSVDRLETRGLLERWAHGTDRRARLVHLTKEGRKLIRRIYADQAADIEGLASTSLSGKKREPLIRLLKKIGYKATVVSKEGNDQPPKLTEKVSKGRK